MTGRGVPTHPPDPLRKAESDENDCPRPSLGAAGGRGGRSDRLGEESHSFLAISTPSPSAALLKARRPSGPSEVELQENTSRGASGVPIKANVGNATVTLYFLEILTMAANIRGRSGSRSRSTWGHTSFLSGRSGQTDWGHTGTSGKRDEMKRPRKSGRTPTASQSRTVPAVYRGCNDTFAAKIHSFRTLYSQTYGPAKCARPTPATLNTFANWISKGAIIQTVTAAQLARWAKMTKKNFDTRTPTTTACKNVLCAKFGKNTIKAVARTKSGSFMVATWPTVNGKRFYFPK